MVTTIAFSNDENWGAIASSSFWGQSYELPVAQLENLAEALLDFSKEADLAAWLHENSN